ncbi:MAG: cation diffusion facilitator family transporter [Candidatus Heimdallarchaeota archaeon]|nr:cation diffusion facilitator family transporter [Candidatus Heimdallarchaeota archaeon]
MRESKQAARTMYLVIAVVLLLIVVKIVIGIIASSTALISDAIHSISDLVVAVASIIGLRLANRPPDKRFAYGYYKIENIVTLFISLVIFGSSGELIYEGIKRILSPPQIDIPYIAMGGAIFSSVASVILGIYLRHVGKQTSSPTIVANAKDKLMDGATSFVVFGAILASFLSINYIEGIITILISILSIKIGFDIAKESILALLDVTDEDLKTKVEEIVTATEGVIHTARLRIRKAGAYYLGDCEIKVDSSIGIEEGHDISEAAEKNVQEVFPEIISFVVHVEPFQKKERRVICPITEPKGLDSPIANHFGRAQKLLLAEVSLEEKAVKSYSIQNNPFNTRKHLAGLALTKMVIDEEINTLITINIGEIAFFKLKGEHVDIFQADCETVKECLQGLMDNNLPPLKEPTKKKEGL